MQPSARCWIKWYTDITENQNILSKIHMNHMSGGKSFTSPEKDLGDQKVVIMNDEEVQVLMNFKNCIKDSG